MSLVQQALEKGVSVEQLNALMDFAERYHENQAKAAYYAALKRFKDNPPRIQKRGVGHNNARYATLHDACEQIIPALAAVGISHQWKTKVADGKVSVSCILTHEMGYSDPDPPVIEASADTSGNKNAIQALGSSIKYLERYTLFAAVGLDDGTHDDDGNGARTKPEDLLSEEILQEWLDSIRTASSVAELKARYMEAQKAAARDATARKALDAAKNEMYRKLTGGRA